MKSERQPRRALLTAALALIPLLFACSLFTSSAGNPPSAATGTPAAEEQAAPGQPAPTTTAEMRTITTLDEEEIQVPVLPPVSFNELLEKNVEEGTWGLGEGLVHLLSYVAAEKPAEDIPGFQPVIAPSGTEIFDRAFDYLEDPADEAEAAELKRLLSTLIPSPEMQARMRANDDGAGSGEVFMTGSHRQGGMPAECRGLVTDGFDVEQSIIDNCYTELTSEVVGPRMAVHYPIWWAEDQDKLDRVGQVLTALVESAETYKQWGEMRDVDAIFGLKQMENSELLGAEIETVDDEHCLLLLWPHLEAEAEPRYKQAIAHEVFHCFQGWNFGENPEQTGRWWSEGSAEYFSNVVYPRADLENRSLGSYYAKSIQMPLLSMEYENFLFFQFLGNELGDPAVIYLLELFSRAGSLSGQASVFADYPGMADTFQEFVVRTMSEGIADSGTGMIVKSNYSLIRTERVDRELEEVFKIDPLVAGRFALSYEQEKRFLQTPVEEDDVRHSTALANLKKDLDSWSELPPDVRSHCDRDERHMLAISSVDEPATFKANITEVELAECDPCLLGPWKMNNDSFERFLDQLYETHGIANTPAGPVEVEVDGGDYLAFNEEGALTLRRADFELTISASGMPGMQVTTDAQGSGIYEADGEELTVRRLESTVTDMRMGSGDFQFSTELGPDATYFSFFGNTVADPGVDITSEAAPVEVAQYVCGPRILEITLPEGTVAFDRVEFLPTAVPTPDS